MKLYHLIEDAGNKGLSEKELELDILKITSNVSDVIAGSLFFAVKGFSVDGNIFISEALEKGAVAIVTEDKDVKIDGCIVFVENVRQALAYASNVFFNKPSEKLCIIGITGTNGKTTTSYMLAHILSQSGIKCGIIGTNGVVVGNVYKEISNTTPDSVSLHSILAEMVDVGVTHVVMEVSSHSLDQDRVWGIRFIALEMICDRADDEDQAGEEKQSDYRKDGKQQNAAVAQSFATGLPIALFHGIEAWCRFVLSHTVILSV